MSSEKYDKLLDDITSSNTVNRCTKLDIHISKYRGKGLLVVSNGILCPICNRILRNVAILTNHISQHDPTIKVVKNGNILQIRKE